VGKIQAHCHGHIRTPVERSDSLLFLCIFDHLVWTIGPVGGVSSGVEGRHCELARQLELICEEGRLVETGTEMRITTLFNRGRLSRHLRVWMSTRAGTITFFVGGACSMPPLSFDNVNNVTVVPSSAMSGRIGVSCSLCYCCKQHNALKSLSSTDFSRSVKGGQSLHRYCTVVSEAYFADKEQ
jgi:hypothetical protein